MKWSVGFGVGLFVTGSAFAGLLPDDLSSGAQQLEGVQAAMIKRGDRDQLLLRATSSAQSKKPRSRAPSTGAIDPCLQSVAEVGAITGSSGRRDRTQPSAHTREAGISSKSKPGKTTAQTGGAPAVDCPSSNGQGSGGTDPGIDGTSDTAIGPDNPPSPAANEEESGEFDFGQTDETLPIGGGAGNTEGSEWPDLTNFGPPGAGLDAPFGPETSLMLPGSSLPGTGLDAPSGAAPSLLSASLETPQNGLAVGVPEPGTLALIGLGLAGLAASRRRKQ